MGMNELMITELVLQNILTKLKPAEVAALLSCLVFQGKTKVSINEMALTSDLVKGIEEIERVYQEISQLEVKYRIIDDSCQDENLKFGLVEVVYMWASNVVGYFFNFQFFLLENFEIFFYNFKPGSFQRNVK